MITLKEFQEIKKRISSSYYFERSGAIDAQENEIFFIVNNPLTPKGKLPRPNILAESYHKLNSFIEEFNEKAKDLRYREYIYILKWRKKNNVSPEDVKNFISWFEKRTKEIEKIDQELTALELEMNEEELQ